MDCSSEEEKLVSNDRGRPLSHSDNNSSVKKALSIAAVVEASAAVPQSERIPPSKAGAVKRAFSKRASPLPFSRFFQLAAAPATLEKATLSPVRAQEAQQDAVSLPLPPPSASAFSTLSKKPKSTEEKEGKHSANLVLDLEAGRCRGAAGDDAALKQLEKKVLFFQVEKKQVEM